MVAITYIEHDGKRHTVDVDADMNLMEGATLNMVPGIVGMCGGICSCATCHCYIPENWKDRLEPPSMGELNMLESASHRRPNSRLGCQIVVRKELEGMEVEMPIGQGDS